jgi:beta-xylosidase
MVAKVLTHTEKFPKRTTSAGKAAVRLAMLKITLCLLLVIYAAVGLGHVALGADGTLVEAGEFKEIYDPTFKGTEPWCINDHTFIRGPDKKWHVFGITHVLPLDFFKDPGKQLLHATADTLTQSPWKKEPFAVTADWDTFGESFLWAPHVIRHQDLYYMFVCVGNKVGHQYKIHLLTSKDLWHWERSPANPLLIDGFDGRDPNVLRVGKQWVLYYTATSRPDGGNHIVACVTSKDLEYWSGRRVVFIHPRQGTFGGPTESPFVVRRGKSYYLFACDGGTINVFLSKEPFSWKIEDQVGTIYAHASEVVRDLNGKWYISHAGWEHGGLSLAPLIWRDALDKSDASLKP